MKTNKIKNMSCVQSRADQIRSDLGFKDGKEEVKKMFQRGGYRYNCVYVYVVGER